MLTLRPVVKSGTYLSWLFPIERIRETFIIDDLSGTLTEPRVCDEDIWDGSLVPVFDFL